MLNVFLDIPIIINRKQWKGYFYESTDIDYDRGIVDVSRKR